MILNVVGYFKPYSLTTYDLKKKKFRSIEEPGFRIKIILKKKNVLMA